jgi:DNA replication licensing factor MCM7
LNLDDVNTDGQDDTSDEYDMLDDVAGGKEARQRNKFRTPKLKYMDMLQQVADRKISEVCIELDDLDNVSTDIGEFYGMEVTRRVV